MTARVPLSRSVVALVAAPIVWTIYFWVVYLWAEAACELGWGAAGRVTLGAAVPALMATLWLTVRAYRQWRTSPDPLDESGATGAGLAFAGVLIGSISVLGVLAVAVAGVAVPAC